MEFERAAAMRTNPQLHVPTEALRTNQDLHVPTQEGRVNPAYPQGTGVNNTLLAQPHAGSKAPEVSTATGLRPPSTLYAPPTQLGYAPPTQSGYAPPTQLGYDNRQLIIPTTDPQIPDTYPQAPDTDPQLHSWFGAPAYRVR